MEEIRINFQEEKSFVDKMFNDCESVSKRTPKCAR
jgi:hypothetical protein